MNTTPETQQVDNFEVYGREVTAQVTLYAGDSFENLCERVTLTDGSDEVDVQVSKVSVVELGDEFSVFRLDGTL